MAFELDRNGTKSQKSPTVDGGGKGEDKMLE